MKKSILMLAAGALLLATPSCKKGENDPFLSLSSRTGRISGEWKLVSADYTTTNQYEDWFSGDKMEDSWHSMYDGTSMTITHTEKNLTVTSSVTDPSYSYTHSESSTFEKDGSFSWTSTSDGDTESASGFWYFAGKSKSADLKKKESVIITLTQTISGGSTDNYSGKSLSPDAFYRIDRLTGKEMITLIDYSNTDSDGMVDTGTGTMTWEKQ